MPTFSSFSEANLATCHPDLQRLFREVIQFRDCRVICGHRDEQAQNIAFMGGKSQTPWPHSKHNSRPSLAVDVVPYPFHQSDWEKIDRFALFAGFVLGVAHGMGISIRSGLDWDSDGYLRDHRLLDGPHFELTEAKNGS